MEVYQLLQIAEDLLWTIERIPAYRHAPKDSTNPVYTWMYLLDALAGEIVDDTEEKVLFGDTVSIPGWIAEYLLEVSTKIVSLYVSGSSFREWPTDYFAGYNTEEAESSTETEETHSFGKTVEESLDDADEPISAGARVDLVPGALGFIRNGWNAFTIAKNDRKKIEIFKQFLHDRETQTAHAARERIRVDQNLSDDRSVRRVIAEGKALAEARQRAAASEPKTGDETSHKVLSLKHRFLPS